MSNILSRVGNTISFVSQKVQARINYAKTLQVVYLKPKQPSKGNVLLSYRIEPFLLKPGQPMPNDHTWYWEVWQIAQTFLDLGYNVDVIQFHNDKFVPQKHYAFFIDIRHRMEALAPKLNKDCIKIFHVDIANMVFRNAAECNRLLEVQQRKGVTLKPQRFEVPNLGIEYADCAIVLGNDFTTDTFKYANKPMYRIPISSPVVYPYPDKKDFEAVRKRFLWFGGSALVLKGLDLVLDAFAQMPEYHLTVCGPVSNDKEFEQAFYKELYETPNIHTYGWIDVSSPDFIEVTNNCLGLVYPSVSEGQSGAVISCLQAGLIPILSYESGVDVHDFGVIFDNLSLEEIKAKVISISNLPVEDLKFMSRQAWEYARANHTKDKFAQVYRNVVEQIIENHSQKKHIGSMASSKQTVSSHH
ncbi:glycosyl transferase family 1 [Nostoc sp. 'Peltigera membranacea cyanobiont' 213]|uniref:glycosyltransferase n=1 Tax=Nostoc sp. 'Peltigera membranacea cyanobiont' 213 TaxID=2014530 RepID=UPI000B95253F|nr:glycosyltransferase [Nostoc sp. 'Peltigera membranacea cyanobiont' 213]OYD95958.1 glycosyl transferase family 1 [Nostoc sp. 'Peltigera membranacea cyanobiont' 213]